MIAFRSVWVHAHDRVWRSMRHRALIAAVVVAAALLGAPVASGQTTDQGDLKALGHVPSHGTFSQFPWESIDTLTGNVILSFTDLVLPGNAGFQLAIQRTWNANELPATGWRWGVGPILHVTGVSYDPSTLTLPDGSVLTLVPTAQPGIYMTIRQFWRVTLTDTEHKAELPDGTVWFFQQAWGLEYFPVRMEDQFGNAVDVVWDWTNRTILQVIQHVGTQTRVVEFTYWNPTSSLLKSMSYAGRTWQYVWPSNENPGVMIVIPPEGPSWQFASSGSYVLVPQPGGGSLGRNDLAMTVTLPSGGWVRYETSGYGDCGSVVQCRIPTDPGTCETVPRPCFYPEGIKLRTRTVGGPGIPAGTWSFTYEQAWWEIGPYAYDSEYRTTILGPNIYLRHIHKDPSGLTAPLREIIVGTGPGEANIVERTTFDWRPLRAWPGDPPPLFRGSYRDQVPTAVETVRAGRTYRRSFTYGDDTELGHLGHFGQPVEIVETGDFTRTTDIAYHAFTGTRWLSDAVDQVTVDGVVTSAAVYDNNTGFATSRTALGVTTTFTPDDWGNVASQTDANGHTTTFDHTWGVVSGVHTPTYTTTFGINEHGETIAATQRGFTTAFTYDGLGRQTRVHPPIGNDTVTSYAEDASWVKVARGPSWTMTALDGFGRAIATETSVGVKTLTTYNALGQVSYASAPYTGVQHTGTQFTYDVLGRVTDRTNADSTVVHSAYDAVEDGLRTTITDELGRQTQEIWQAAGTLDAPRLARVVDAADQTTRYTYNTFGSLSEAVAPGTVVRTWTYSAQNRLMAQTQPESGTVTYQYDAVGNLTSQTDARQHTTTYGYDDNNRLTLVTSPDPQYTTTITYDASNNRRTVANGYVSTTFDYDGANRLTRRTDAVNSRTFVSAYTPDANGNVVDVQYPSSNHVRYTYDTENRVVQVVDPARGLTFATGISYHPAGGLTGYLSGDGATHSVTYDSRQRPAHLSATGVADLPDLTYGYDGVGNVLAITDLRPGKSATFGYDALDRLTSATGGGWGTVTYGYDPPGNRTAKTFNGVTTGYVYTSQRLTATTGAEPASFEYDATGNQTRDALGQYAYTAANMLETATLDAGAVSLYRYDGDGQRTVTLHGSTTTTHSLRGLGQVVSEFEESGSELRWTLDQVYLGSRLLAAARPPAGTLSLTITKAGAGSGTVTSTPAGIACGPACSGATAAFTAGTVVSLVATAAENWVFVGWSGEPDCADGVVMLTDAKTCVATFAASAPAFAKQSPAQGTGGLTTPVTLQWAPVTNASYSVCWDTINNGLCDTGWQATGTATSLVVPTLASGTYYWQVKTNSDVPADDGTWWSFTVAAPPLFTKVAPSHGASGLGSALTLQWTPVPNEGYWICWDTIDNGQCDTMWWPSPVPTQAVSGLLAGTYYWQVKTAGGLVPADNGAWWSFSVSAPALFVKQSPALGATGLGGTVTLQWTAVPEEGYWVCWDTIDNGTCDTMWWPNGAATAKVVSGLLSGTYYWQVKTAGGLVPADNGAWHHFTVSTAALFTKQSPANGATGLGSTVTLQWTAVPDEGYYVCWDTTDNNACDTTWWPTAAGTSRVVEGLAAGTYYWQARTAGGAVLADDGTWHHFTVAGGPATVAWAGPPNAVARPTSADPARRRASLAVIAVTTAGVGLVVLVAGLRRRRFAVAAGVVLFMLAPAAALAQTTTQVVEYYSTDALGSVRAVTMQVNGEWRVVSRHDFMPFGEEVAPPPPPSDKWLFSGKERDTETGLDYFGARYMRASAGRFASVDPLQTVDENLADPQRWNRYVYGLSNPIRYADLSGLTPQDRVAAAWAFLAAKVVYKGGGGWDATNPNDGLDCAGLVRHVFMKDPDSHVSLNRSVGDEWSQLNAAAKAGTAEVSTNIKDARVGDAIFWSENGKMAHTAIIVEINKATGIVKVVHAAGKKKGLTWQRCSDADGNFWGQIFVGIGRPKESAQ